MAAQRLGKSQSHEESDTLRGGVSPWENLSVSALDADLAYFHARLEWIGEPETINQKAQVDTFRYLIPAVGKIQSRLKRKAPVKT